MRMRKKKNLAPRMEACGAYLIRDPFALRGRWRELMPEARELRVELGCGKGGFTVGTAAAEPEVLLIAVEKVPDAMVVAMEKARDAALRNVWFVDGDAALLPDMFADGEIDRLYINFCDPWPKSNQKKRRLTHGNFLKNRRFLRLVFFGSSDFLKSTGRCWPREDRSTSRPTTTSCLSGRWRRSHSSGSRCRR